MKKSSIYSQGKEFLSFIRKGDFAHAGEEEAIELTLQDYDKNPSRQILDIGCGLGGTAQYIQTQGWGKVYGIDIEQDAIDYAENKYSDIEFQTCSANDIDKKFSANQFDLIMIFNAFFCFTDQKDALRAMANIAKPTADLVIFDYAWQEPNSIENPFSGGTVAHFAPLHKETMAELLLLTGWKLKKYTDISADFLKWYAMLIQKMEILRQDAIAKFGASQFDRMYSNFKIAYEAFEKNKLQGVILQARLHRMDPRFRGDDDVRD